MKKLLFIVLFLSPCFAEEPAIPRVALHQVQIVMLAGIVATQDHQVPAVTVDCPQIKNTKSKKHSKVQRNQKFPRKYHTANKQQWRR